MPGPVSYNFIKSMTTVCTSLQCRVTSYYTYWLVSNEFCGELIDDSESDVFQKTVKSEHNCNDYLYVKKVSRGDCA